MMHTQADSAPSAAPAAVLDRALALVRFLRAHCTWDAEQTPDSLRRYLLEETYEVLDAITAEDDAGLCDELGDLLLNLAFQVVLAEERNAFTREQVVAGLETKMRRRHPHLYGGAPEAWEAIKARERAEQREFGPPASLLDDLSTGLEPLLRAARVQRRVAEVGFDWPDARGAWDKVREEVEEVRAELDHDNPAALEEEVGDLLFAVVNLARLAGVDAPAALTRANAKFDRRFRALEELADQRGVALQASTLEQLDTLWDAVKQSEQPSAGRAG